MDDDDDGLGPPEHSSDGQRRQQTRIAALLVLIMLVGVLGVRYYAASSPSVVDQARAAAVRFFDRYMDQDGRLVRRDQDGDTVSEGQAYAMLLAVALGDQDRFERAWRWAASHLQRPDGLLSWHWQAGRVTDVNSATDADLDAAHALVLAGQRFHHAQYLAEGLRIATSIVAEETVELADGSRLLVAGPWARIPPYVVNPSYFSPSAFTVLGEASGDQRWSDLERSSSQVILQLVRDPSSLPSDWAQVEADGRPHPIGSPDRAEAPPRHGLDAARLLVRLATDCGELSRRLAASAGRLLPLDPGRVVAAYDLQGKPLTSQAHPLADVAASAVALVSGDRRAAQRLLAHAESLERRASTYYGSAWVALGRIMLTTTLLTDCSSTRYELNRELEAQR
jgi:endoglucanase